MDVKEKYKDGFIAKVNAKVGEEYEKRFCLLDVFKFGNERVNPPRIGIEGQQVHYRVMKVFDSEEEALEYSKKHSFEVIS